MPYLLPPPLRIAGRSNDQELQSLTSIAPLDCCHQGFGYQSQELGLEAGHGLQVNFRQKSSPASETRLGLFMHAAPQSPPDNAPCHVSKCPSLSYSSRSPLPPRAMLSHSHGRNVVTGDYPGLACNERVLSNPKLNPVQSLWWMKEQRPKKTQLFQREQYKSLNRKQKAVSPAFSHSLQDTQMSKVDIAASLPFTSCKKNKSCPESKSSAAGSGKSSRLKRRSTMTADTRVRTERARQRKPYPWLTSPVRYRKAQKAGSTAVVRKGRASVVSSDGVVDGRRVKDSTTNQEQDGISLKVRRRFTELELDRRERIHNRNEGCSTQIEECSFSSTHTSFSPGNERRADHEDKSGVPSINCASEMVSMRVDTSAQPYRDPLVMNAFEALMSTNDGIMQDPHMPADGTLARQMLHLTSRPGGPFASKSTAWLPQRIRRSSSFINESLIHLKTFRTRETTTSKNRAVSSSDSGYSSYAATVNGHDDYSKDGEAKGIFRRAIQSTIEADLDRESSTSSNSDQFRADDAGTLDPIHSPSPVVCSPIHSTHNILEFAIVYRIRYHGLDAVEEGYEDRTTSNGNLGTVGHPSSDRVDEDVHRNHPYRHHRLFYSHPHLRDLYPPDIPSFVGQPIQRYSIDHASGDCEQAVCIGPNYVAVLNNTVAVTCESCLRRFVMTADRLNVLDRHQRLFCRTPRQQKLQKWWHKLETRLGLEVVTDHVEKSALSGSGETRNVKRHLC